MITLESLSLKIRELESEIRELKRVTNISVIPPLYKEEGTLYNMIGCSPLDLNPLSIPVVTNVVCTPGTLLVTIQMLSIRSVGGLLTLVLDPTTIIDSSPIINPDDPQLLTIV